MDTYQQGSDTPEYVFRKELINTEIMATVGNGEQRDQIPGSRTIVLKLVPGSAQRVPEPDPLPGISFDTRPDPIQF